MHIGEDFHKTAKMQPLTLNFYSVNINLNYKRVF